jgi:hypothetical protein
MIEAFDGVGKPTTAQNPDGIDTMSKSPNSAGTEMGHHLLA